MEEATKGPPEVVVAVVVVGADVVEIVPLEAVEELVALGELAAQLDCPVDTVMPSPSVVTTMFPSRSVL